MFTKITLLLFLITAGICFALFEYSIISDTVDRALYGPDPDFYTVVSIIEVVLTLIMEVVFGILIYNVFKS